MSARLVPDAAFLAALETAHSVRFSAYVLNAGSAVVKALASACDRGAVIDVLLDGAPYRNGAGITRVNAAAASELSRHGAHVHTTSSADPAMHLKAAVIDGTAYLDDRNWASEDRDTIVALDDADQVAAVAAALSGVAVPGGAATTFGSLAIEKQAALALEARTIDEAPGDRIDVETESFGATAVSKALAHRAARGDHVRLLVSQAELRGASGRRERLALAKLAADGIDIEATANTEKLCVAGDDAWIGSANATFSPGPSLDWGLHSNDPAIVAGLERAFERNGSAGVKIKPAQGSALSPL